MYATESKTLLEFLVDLLSDKEALAAFKHDPEAALKAAGLEDVCVEDIQELVPVVLEKCSPEDCAKYEDDCDEDRCYDDKWQDYCEDEHHHGKHYDDCDDDDHGRSHHDVEIHKVITHLTYVTNNFTIDNSINVWNAGDGDVLIVSGDGNIIGDDNVTGDGNTFGDNNVKETFGDGNVVGDGNGSGNFDGELNVDLGLGGLPIELPGGETFDGELAGLQVPNDVSSLVEESEEEQEEPETTSVVEDDDEPSYTEVSGDGNIIGNGNVTGDGNTFGDGNTDSSYGDGNVVGNGNGSGNVSLAGEVDLGGDEPQVLETEGV